jgi:hypothetical protein
MSLEKNIRKTIPALYKCQAEDLLLFGWVTGQQRIVSTISTRQSVQMFMEFYDISEDEWSQEAALMTMSRMREKYHSSRREGGGQW